MAFQKGHPKIGGRKKARPNAKTATLKEWVQAVLEDGRSTFEAKLKDLPPSRYVEAYLALLSYAVPKVQSVSIEAKLQAEYKQIALLMEAAPSEFVERIARRLAELQEEAAPSTTATLTATKQDTSSK